MPIPSLVAVMSRGAYAISDVQRALNIKFEETKR
jgi:hypothetical protein